ncbi:lipoprotein Spr/probable lipoprotein NlpC [Marinobacterium halophilum]|uniref:Lipoprotein Spr/probable lipoprotein NlpC n=1 Tax=Marinobacterium halophilum TaxID=267374 RepID=A0A2P8ESM7_9GAMM|nr:NlpC/P60 family protein [Marinobacterium halophilum]PSL12479.1 lipoprotein Spr/probable lipoprotein NlpC [Marinobacterium halophilum]
MTRRITVSILLCLLLAGCAGTPARFDSVSHIDDPVRNRLLLVYAEWAGTPYRFGGESRQGVDCSGFIKQVYWRLDGQQLPRTTAQQSGLGVSVAREHLQPADLVFFKTGWKQRHAGIYLGGGEFMHASSQRGVMISRLDNPYWQDAWWMARRMPLAVKTDL